MEFLGVWEHLEAGAGEALGDRAPDEAEAGNADGLVGGHGAQALIFGTSSLAGGAP